MIEILAGIAAIVIIGGMVFAGYVLWKGLALVDGAAKWLICKDYQDFIWGDIHQMNRKIHEAQAKRQLKETLIAPPEPQRARPENVGPPNPRVLGRDDTIPGKNDL